MNDQGFNKALHLVFGDTVARALENAWDLSAEQILIGYDPISCGPAPATRDLNQWRSVRENFLKEQCSSENDIFSFDHYGETELLLNLERLDEETKTIVQIGRGLPDQLFLSWIVFLFNLMEKDLSGLWFVEYYNMKSGQNVLCMAELRVEEISKYCPEPTYLESEQIEELRLVQKVYTSDDPAVLSNYINSKSPMPVLHQAMCKLVHRYPDLKSGLCILDEKLLSYARTKSPKAIRIVGWTMAHFALTLDLISDYCLFSRLLALGNTDQNSPALAIAGNTKNMRECQAALTLFAK